MRDAHTKLAGDVHWKVRLTLAYVLRSREFDTQRETTQFGSATVSVAF